MKRTILFPLLIMILGAAFIACGSPYRHHYDRYGYGGYGYPNSGYNNPYDIGYQRGLQHGLADRRAGFDFEYEHDSEFRSGISYDRYINDQFRRGYVAGYEAGYYSRGHYGY